MLLQELLISLTEKITVSIELLDCRVLMMFSNSDYAVISNYVSAVHEKIFIIFMMSSLLHMWCRAKVGSMGNMGDRPLKGNRTVWLLFFVSVASTIGLVVFFLRHRLLCRPMCKLHYINIFITLLL